MTVDLAAVLTALAQLVVIGGGLAGGYWGLRRWVRRAAGASERTEVQTATSNGRSLGQLAQDTEQRVMELRQLADINRARIDALDARVDRHIIAGHRSE